MRNYPQNPWDSGWRLVLGWAVAGGIIFSLIYFLKVRPKLEICETYYKDLSTFNCFVSNYGIPPRSSK